MVVGEDAPGPRIKSGESKVPVNVTRLGRKFEGLPAPAWKLNDPDRVKLRVCVADD
jgi:L,D-peptidoglycan transpeptidase YkuD (ErfK/YbiS/YcfS/YnhG family)